MHRTKNRIEVNMCITGDAGVGKTSFLMHCKEGGFAADEGYIPTILDPYDLEFWYEGGEILMRLHDTAGIEYTKFRSLVYSNCYIFVMAYSCVDRTSLENISNHWAPEVRSTISKSKMVLLGLKEDLTAEPDYADEVVTEANATMVAARIGALKTYRCSTLLEAKQSHLNFARKNILADILKITLSRRQICGCTCSIL